MNNVILIGMPSSGKSTLGVLLAKMLGYDFLDTDLVIQKRTGKRLQQILDEEGREAFLAAEEEALLSVRVRRTVIATGGSAVYSAAGMHHLKKDGVAVYLKVPFRLIRRRLSNLATRGVVLAPGQTLEMLFRERSALYEKYADLIFEESADGKEHSLSENAVRLVALLEEQKP